MQPEDCSKNLLTARLAKELENWNLSCKTETILNDLSTYKVEEYIYISSFKRKNNLTYKQAVNILNMFLKKNILKEVFVVSFQGRWIGEYYTISEIPRELYDEETGIDVEISEEHIFTCFEVVKNVY
ncbi:hypothetical protein [Enterococcus hirae]|uniref:hypothetical protein n=1 Tax=Enterococcus TaxID=1350 RepID=UPI001146E8E1|nr:hypothetical protein [Enterococcus hirae]QQB25235.1 hypothetical protein I6I14_00100 [Enterococcus hirae]